ncbi:DEAD/DEAH box helicase [bacterium]|nr:DEAD/DEAH box helicase [bacterium]
MNNITILLDNQAHIAGLSKRTSDEIKAFLTISNPVFQKGLQLGLTNWGVPRSLQYFSESNKILSAPIGSLNDILNILADHISMNDVEVCDNRASNKLPKYFNKVRFSPVLRDYQQDMINACEDKSIGVIQAKTGAGKTIFALSLILKKQEATLFLVNTVELANQTIASFAKNTNLSEDDIGFIGSGKFSLKPITVGLHQTMARLSEEQFGLLNDHIGMVIADEVHICPAKTYYKTLTNLRAKYKWGISGTPKREDGLTRAIFFATGPLIHQVPESKLENVLITPDVEYIETDYTYPIFSTEDYQPMISDLSENRDRNDIIIEKLKEFKGKSTVLLCTRLSQVEYLKDVLGEEAVILTSKMKKKDRVEVMSQLHKREKDIVISTYGLFSTGIDIPHLEVLFLCAPLKSEIKLRQAAGRLMRKAKGKTSANIIDIVDPNVGILYNQSRTRKRVLSNL